MSFKNESATIGVISLMFVFVSPDLSEASPTSSLEASIEYLRTVQDQFHDRIPLYEDVSSAGNRFHTYAKIPDAEAAVSINGSWTDNPHSGATAIRCEFQDLTGLNFGGFYFLNGLLNGDDISPVPNFGDVPDAGVDLSGTVRLTFWARGENGGEQIEFFLAGVGRDALSGVPTAPFPGSSPRHPPQDTRTTLTSYWQQYSIDGLSFLDLSYVLGGFAWVASAVYNQGGAVFYLDDIEYELTPAARSARLDEPRFLASYTTQPIQPDSASCATDPGFDLALRNMAFSYDNALALLAFLAHDTPDSLRRARLIGDAFVYAANHDRFLNTSPYDGSIRSGYAAADLVLPPGWTPNGIVGAVALPGFFCELPQMFFETGQEALDVGNNAWTMVALLALYRVTGESSYLSTARGIGEFIDVFRNNSGLYQGYQGGIDDPEGAATPRSWASGEHNLDVYAAFSVMTELTGEPLWLDGAAHAQTFLEAIWDPGIGCYRAGTVDPNMLNTLPDQLPVDVQAWAVLALPNALSLHPNLLACPEIFHQTSTSSFLGFDFNEDRDGIWFEGTAQMATSYTLARDFPTAMVYQSQLAQAQAIPPYGNGFGIAAATIDNLSTGFGFEYYQRFHIAVAAWNVFAQLPLNPYYLQGLPLFADGFESGNTSQWSNTVP